MMTHQTETFSVFLWIHWSPVNSHHKSQWHGALMFSLICTWTNVWVKNQDAGDLKHFHAHYDFTVMNFYIKAGTKCLPLGRQPFQKYFPEKVIIFHEISLKYVSGVGLCTIDNHQHWFMWLHGNTRQQGITWNNVSPGPVFCLLLGVSSGCAQPITGQVTEVTWPVIGWA